MLWEGEKPLGRVINKRAFSPAQGSVCGQRGRALPPRDAHRSCQVSHWSSVTAKTFSFHSSLPSPFAPYCTAAPLQMQLSAVA